MKSLNHLGLQMTETFQNILSRLRQWCCTLLDNVLVFRPSNFLFSSGCLSTDFQGVDGLNCFRGSLVQALSASVRYSQPLVLFFYNRNDDRPNFIMSNILKSPQFIKALTDSHAIFFACVSTSPDVKILSSHILEPSEFPIMIFTCSLPSCSSTVSRDSQPATRVWSNICVTGVVTHSNAQLQVALDMLQKTFCEIRVAHSGQNDKERKIQEDRQLRAKQQEAYVKALEKDREREHRKQQENRETMEKQAQQDHLNVQRVQQRNEFFTQCLLSTFSSKDQAVRETPQDATFPVKLRLENGMTVVRYCEESMPLADLFTWVDSLPDIWNGGVNSPVTFLRNIIASNSAFNNISEAVLSHLLDDKTLVDQICGMASNTQIPLPSTPSNYVLYAKCPNFPLHRPNSKTTTLKDLGVSQGVNLFIQPQG